MRRRSGFTLVELMVGLAVGLFVSVIAISLFVSTRKLQAVDSASNRMSENARLAFDLLHKDLRLAGFRGCSNGVAEPVSVLNATGDDFLVAGNGIRGYRGTGAGGFSPALTAALSTVPTPPLPDSDVVSVRVPVDTLSLALVSSMPNSAAAPDVGTETLGNNAIASGDIVLMSNCKTAVLFQVTGAAAPSTTGLLPHDTGGPSPGNAVATLNVRYNAADTAIYRMQTRHYYVADSANPGRAGTRSLWRLTVPAPAVGPAAEEVVLGIDRLNIVYGVETDATGDRAVDRYATADNVADWNDVLSARIQMLATTVNDGTARAASSVQFAGSTVAAGDRRLREVFTEVVAFRNLMP